MKYKKELAWRSLVKRKDPFSASSEQLAMPDTDDEQHWRKKCCSHKASTFQFIMHWPGLYLLSFVLNLVLMSTWLLTDSQAVTETEFMPSIAIVDYVELLEHLYLTIPTHEIESYLLGAQTRIERLKDEGVIIFDASLIQSAPSMYYLPIEWLMTHES